MNFSFDFISDLHVRPDEDFDWSGQQTSLYCVVAGDVARDRETLLRTLRNLSSCYLGTFYIDGNAEHRNYLSDLDSSYQDLANEIQKIPGIIYLFNNVVVVDGIAFIACNGWWSYNFDPNLNTDECIDWYCNYTHCTKDEAISIIDRAYSDAAYIAASISKLQRHPDVKSIVVISHTLPAPFLVSHDIELVGHPRFNSLGNHHLHTALTTDSESKVITWCFGHYHRAIDREIAGVQFISNPRGRINTPWCQNPYYPKRIEVIPQVR